MLLGFRARFQIPVNGQEQGLSRRARSVGQAGFVIQNLVDGDVLIDWAKIICRDKYDK
jgi:hypothetical protein